MDCVLAVGTVATPSSRHNNPSPASQPYPRVSKEGAEIGLAKLCHHLLLKSRMPCQKISSSSAGAAEARRTSNLILCRTTFGREREESRRKKNQKPLQREGREGKGRDGTRGKEADDESSPVHALSPASTAPTTWTSPPPTPPPPPHHRRCLPATLVSLPASSHLNANFASPLCAPIHPQPPVASFTPLPWPHGPGFPYQDVIIPLPWPLLPLSGCDHSHSHTHSEA